MTEDIAFYVGLAGEVDGPLVELAVGNGRVAVPVAQATGRPVIGIDSSPAMLEQARTRAAEAGVELDLREGDMRELVLDEQAALVYCPFRSLLHVPTWADRRRTFERVAASLRPGGRFAWNAFAFDHHVAAQLDGQHQGRTCASLGSLCGQREPGRHDARGRRHQLAVVGNQERMVRADRCRGT
jgi:ubiquinone/menaquinone biosynthesis C-methylase UbiE